jgi:hypothetical protein
MVMLSVLLVVSFVSTMLNVKSRHASSAQGQENTPSQGEAFSERKAAAAGGP